MTEDLAEANELCPALLLPCNPDAESSVWGTRSKTFGAPRLHYLYVRKCSFKQSSLLWLHPIPQV